MDSYKVWEIRAMKKPGQQDAVKMLERIAKQVQPIMRNHKWRVNLLSDFCQQALLGQNIGGGEHVKLKLRTSQMDPTFIPFDEVLDTMLHELCHNVYHYHDASFYQLWDELREECAELMVNGISGTGKGFDILGRRLGGPSQNRPLTSLRQAMNASAQGRQHTPSLLPLGPGPNHLGGDKSIMSALIPTQAAVMAAERRLRDEIWCAKSSSSQPATTGSRKRSRGSTSSSTPSDCHRTNFIDLTSTTDKGEESVVWECRVCTLLNPPLARFCGVCCTGKPEVGAAKFRSWCCYICTLENGIEMDRCLACGQWRYSDA